MEQELQDLNACALSSWEGILEKLKASRRPPIGLGSGYVKPQLFRRLFLGAVHRLSRQGEMREMCDALMKAELEKVYNDLITFISRNRLPRMGSQNNISRIAYILFIRIYFYLRFF